MNTLDQTKILKPNFWTSYSIYHLRWQLATLVMLPAVYLLENAPTALSLAVAKLWGGVVFYKVDQWIFKGDKSSWKQFGIYSLRWQLAGVIMIPSMMLLKSLSMPLWIDFTLSQFWGALWFWFIDKWIFKKKDTSDA